MATKKKADERYSRFATNKGGVIKTPRPAAQGSPGSRKTSAQPGKDLRNGGKTES